MDAKRTALKYQFAIVTPGEVLWCPYEVFPVMVSLESVGSCLCIPWLSKKMIAEMAEESHEFVSTAIVKYLKKNNEQDTWKDVTAGINKLFRD